MYNVILSAYSCHPHKGSEPGVGWNWLKELAKYNKVYLLFYAEQEQAIAVSEEIKKLPYVNNIVLFPISVPKFFQNRFFRLRYEIWQIKAYFVAKRIIKETKIDIIHQVTLATWWFTGYYYYLKNKKIKLLLGPFLGGQIFPEFGKLYVSKKKYYYEQIRNLIVNFNLKYNILLKRKFSRFDYVLCGNKETYEFFKLISTKTLLFLTTGIHTEVVKRAYDPKNEFNLLFIGNIIETKNISMLIEIMDELKAYDNIKLNIVGEGKLLNYYSTIIKQKSLTNINFLGAVSHSQIKEIYLNNDIFIFLSLREGAPTVILEAMNYEIPIITFNMNGADIMLDRDSGILFSIYENDLVKKIADTILDLSQDENKRKFFAKNAKNRVIEFFDWNKKGLYMQSIYDELMRGK